MTMCRRPIVLTLFAAAIALTCGIADGSPYQASLVAQDSQAQPDGELQRKRTQKDPALSSNPLVATPKPGLTARKPTKKLPAVTKPPQHMNRVMVKFGDTLKARINDQGKVVSTSGFQSNLIDEIEQLRRDFGLTFAYAIPQSDEVLDDIRQRAEEYSGKMQPDMRSLMYLTGDESSLTQAAQLLNDMAVVEYAHWDEKKDIFYKPKGGATGACCLPDGTCSDDVSEADCMTMDGVYNGDDSECATSACPELGACCFPDESCEIFAESVCDDMAGDWGGAGSSCGGNFCVPGACCFIDESLEEPLCFDVAMPVPDGADPGFPNLSIAENCIRLGGFFLGGACLDMDGENRCEEYEVQCGEPGTGSCFATDGSNGTPYCDNEFCCAFICAVDEFCCDEDNPQASWDEICSAQAVIFCNAFTDEATACNVFNESCFEPHQNGGCSATGCCNAVCLIDAFCCENAWGANCVQTAFETCVPVDQSGDTGNFTSVQGYKQTAGYAAALGDIPPELRGFIPTADGQPYVGFGGEGFSIYDPADDPVFDPDNDTFSGIWGFGRELNDVLGINRIEGETETLARGKTIKVGVVEWGFFGPEPFTDANGNNRYDVGEDYVDYNNNDVYDFTHEDLNVILEPGQTINPIPFVSEPDHATACLSIINAIQQDDPMTMADEEIGLVGIAPDAQAYFFPLTSLEEGARESAAWTSVLATFGPGDVVSASYGPGPLTGTLNGSQSMWTMFRQASDLGITVCIAAGNDCYDLGGGPDLGDSGIIIVGACSPGAPHYRLNFSNFCEDPPDDNSIGNMVHLKAWGQFVASAGYGDLFGPRIPGQGIDKYRSYSAQFNGTSAASPQIAGVVACLQGLAKQFYGVPLTPETIRGALGAPGDSPGNPAPRLFGGFNDTPGGPCFLDVDPSEGPHRIGPFPDVAGNFGSAASSILNQSGIGFDDAPLVNDIIVLRGERMFGNHFSVKGSDNNYFVVRSEYTDRNARPNAPLMTGLANVGDVNALAQVNYLATGQITDVVVDATSDTDPVNSLVATVEYQGPTSATVFLFTEFFDWTTNKWQFAGFNFNVGGGADEAVQYPAPFAQRFVRESDSKVFCRNWTIGFSIGNGNSSLGTGPVAVRGNYIMRYDVIDVFTAAGFGETRP